MYISTFFFACGYPVIPVPFVENPTLSSLNCFGILVENQLTMKLRVYFWTLNCSPLICVYIFTPEPHSLDYCS